MKPPVVLLNGYQTNCTNSTFTATFGTADQILQTDGRASVFFDNCAFPGRPAIEELGNRFGALLRDLRYDDGQPVPVVDIVAHSMGGLIVRSYLSGKQEADGVFNPPPETRIRKAVFLATPHFGTTLTSFFGSDTQIDELTTGSRFLYDLATWNQGTDDLRGIDAVAVIGDTGRTPARFDDAIVPLTSASLGFLTPARTRVVPHCHVPDATLRLLGLCPQTAPGIADMRAATHESARIIVSFLNGAEDWRSVGQAAEQHSILSTDAGLAFRLKSSGDQFLALESGAATGTGNQSFSLTVRAQQVAFNERVTAQALQVSLRSGGQATNQTYTAAAGATRALTLKAGPNIARVLPSASVTFPFSVASGSLISIYGERLDGGEVTVNGASARVLIAVASQINAILPDGLSGLVKLRVRNAGGEHTINLLIEAAVPALFTQDGTGRGIVSALNAVTGALVTRDTALRAGEFVALYLTGLGEITRRDSLDFANVQPSVTIGDKPCAVSYAGRAPGFAGLDQINCQLAGDLTNDPAAAVIVTSAGRTSNTVTLPVR
ncbi:MAG: hypothetical protein ACRD8O_11630 [Bryobacteraceae bacterium]